MINYLSVRNLECVLAFVLAFEARKAVLGMEGRKGDGETCGDISEHLSVMGESRQGS